jgi:hypothetical protein
MFFIYVLSLLRIPYVVAVTPGFQVAGPVDRKHRLALLIANTSLSDLSQIRDVDEEPNKHDYRFSLLLGNANSPLKMSTQLRTDPRRPDLHLSPRPIFSRRTLSLAVTTSESTEQEDRWYRHAERVMCSIFCTKEEEEQHDSWAVRAVGSKWNDDPNGYPIGIIISKIRTILEANDKNTSVVHRLRCIVWLGLLMQSWEEAEVYTCIQNTL